MKMAFISVALLACGLTGCIWHHAAQNPAKPAAKAKTESGTVWKFEGRDDFKIEKAVYGYLLEKHPWGDGEYTAIFLEGSGDWVAALIRNFPKHRPPLKPSKLAQVRPGAAPIDRDTGKPALILSAKAMDPTNGVSEAIGTWYGGEEVSGLCAFVLMKVDGEWTIQSAK
jgi:hypothetical protein